MKNEPLETLDVIFYREDDGQILAVFPHEIFDGQGNITCYAHVGQHSGASPEFLDEQELATLEQSKDLKWDYYLFRQ